MQFNSSTKRKIKQWVLLFCLTPMQFHNPTKYKITRIQFWQNIFTKAWWVCYRSDIQSYLTLRPSNRPCILNFIFEFNRFFWFSYTSRASGLMPMILIVNIIDAYVIILFTTLDTYAITWYLNYVKLQGLSECVTDNTETILPHFMVVKSADYSNNSAAWYLC